MRSRWRFGCLFRELPHPGRTRAATAETRVLEFRATAEATDSPRLRWCRRVVRERRSGLLLRGRARIAHLSRTSRMVGVRSATWAGRESASVTIAEITARLRDARADHRNHPHGIAQWVAN